MYSKQIHLKLPNYFYGYNMIFNDAVVIKCRLRRLVVVGERQGQNRLSGRRTGTEPAAADGAGPADTGYSLEPSRHRQGRGITLADIDKVEGLHLQTQTRQSDYTSRHRLGRGITLADIRQGRGITLADIDKVEGLHQQT